MSDGMNDRKSMPKKKKDTCIFCGKEIKGMHVGAGGGRNSCQLCWEQRHPPVPITNFKQLLGASELRDHLNDWLQAELPANLQQELISRYNAEMAERYCFKLNQLLSREEDR